ncbi:MAG: TRAP transporter substrate-binding protein [Verrucomicrobiota bacterium]
MRPTTSFFIVGLLAGLLGACVLFAWIGQREGAEPKKDSGRVLTVAHVLPTTHPVHQGLEEFGRALEELSGGQLVAQIFPNEQLGNETELLEKTQQGSIDITKSSAGPIGNFVSVFQVFSLPYLFRDGEHQWRTLDGEIGQELLEAVATTDQGTSSGLVGLGYFDAGSRSFYTTRPVAQPSDLVGMKIRVQQNPVAQDTVRAMGASAVAISFGELYTSLKQGGVDGAENNPPSFHSSRHFEVCPFYTLDRHSTVPDVLVGSSALWESLSEIERGWIREAVARASDFQRRVWAEETEKTLALLADAGITITEPDPDPFREAAAPVIQKYATGARAEYVKRIEALTE